MITDKQKNRWWADLVSGLVILGLVAIIYIGANASYFAKQFNYWWKTNVTHQSVATTSEYRTPNTVYLPSLGIEAPLVYIKDLGEPSFQAGLAQGVVHYPGTAQPGQSGNAFYFGHSSDYATKPGHFKSVFALLPHITQGAEIVVTDDAGKVYKYKVIKTVIVAPNETQWLSQGDGTQKLITLQTSYPVGTALKRFLAIGEMEQ